MNVTPMFRRRRDKSLVLADTPEAVVVRKVNAKKSFPHSMPWEKVKERATAMVMSQGGDPQNKTHVLSQCEIQFGQFRSKTFHWLAENALGYAAYLVNGMRTERPQDNNLSRNKFAFKAYLESFADGKEAVQMKRNESLAKQVKQHKPPQEMTPMPTVTTPPEKRTTATGSQKSPEEIPDEELVSHVVAIEASQTTNVPIDTAPGPSKKTPTARVKTPTKATDTVEEYPLPDGWKETLPAPDHRWVSRALFKTNKKSGKAELAFSRVDKLWWHPPQPALICSQVPHADRYYASRLLLWMPRKLWQVQLYCPHAECENHLLTSAGIYPRVRQVLDIDCYYSLAAEYLECTRCRRKLISWSSVLVQQLDVGHRLQFPVLLTYRNACDIRVVRLLRQRGLGNSATQLQKKLAESHNESMLQKTAHYLTDCQAFCNRDASKLVVKPNFQRPPVFPVVPSFRWLQTAYCCDVLRRLDEVLSSITSVFGRVLKMDSTKKIVKKLAGHSAGTASWATNVGNEFGQVLICVLTASEGHGLGPMVSGIVNRYRTANAPPPVLLYVDRDCCGIRSQLREQFSAWPNLCIRLDVWHFMRRIAIGCTTDSHPLYSIFMGRLSQCIFKWSKDDINQLMEAKKTQMESQKMTNMTDRDVLNRIKKKELSLHCRRCTREVEETTTLITDLLATFSGDQGLDSLGVPLLDSARIWDIWEQQKRHVICIQDPEDIELYTKTGSLTKGGVELPTYRCARGSTSLESFHLHLNRFIPGTSASDTHFQAYLLEGLVRWNEDRALSAVSGTHSAQQRSSQQQTYSGVLKHSINNMSMGVFGSSLIPQYTEPRKYTGELVGVQYLYSQTGQVLQDLALDEEKDVHIEESDDSDDDEGFEEEYVDQTVARVEDIVPKSSKLEQLVLPKQVLSLPATEEQSITEPSESFWEDLTQTKKTSFPSAGPTATISSSTPTVAEVDVEQPDECLGPDNVEGFGGVQELAGYLASLRDKTGALTNQQAADIIRLWNNLSEFDKQPTKFSPRHKKASPTGRFKVSKSQVAPGVDSTKRCFLGQNTGPAQWPDCNRYVEALVSRLCEAYPTPTRSGNASTSRWTQITRTYKQIRQMVLDSARVTQNTTIQLVEINRTTLTQWYNRRGKKQEKDMLEQGISLPHPPMASSSPMPTARSRPESLPVPETEAHKFELPPNTSGKARVKKRLDMDEILTTKPPSPTYPPSMLPLSVTPPSKSTPIIVYITPQGIMGVPQQVLPTPLQQISLKPPPTQAVLPATSQPPSSSLTPAQASSNISASTLRYRKRKVNAILAGDTKVKYTPRTKTFKCKECGQERLPPHQSYFCNWYCPIKSTKTFEDWKKDLQKSKGYGQRKK